MMLFVAGISLQEAALETLKESMKNQPKLVPTRPLENLQKPKQKPINYTRGSCTCRCLAGKHFRIMLIITCEVHVNKVAIMYCTAKCRSWSLVHGMYCADCNLSSVSTSDLYMRR